MILRQAIDFGTQLMMLWGEGKIKYWIANSNEKYKVVQRFHHEERNSSEEYMTF